METAHIYTAEVWDNPEEILELSRDEDLMELLSGYLGVPFNTLVEALELRASPSCWKQVPIKGLPGQYRSVNFEYGYDTFYLPKINGGLRKIRNPAPALKIVQRAFLQLLYGDDFPISDVATGGVPGRSIVDNARAHVGKNFLVAMDIEGAYPNTTAGRVSADIMGPLAELFREAYPHLDSKVRDRFIQALVVLVTKDNELPQGAPTSMYLLARCMRRMQDEMATGMDLPVRGFVCKQYVDDIGVGWDYSEGYYQVFEALNIAEVMADAMERGDDPDVKLLRIDSEIKALRAADIWVGHESELEALKSKAAKVRARLESLGLDDLVVQLDAALDESGIEIVDVIGMVKNRVTEVVEKHHWGINKKKTRAFYPGHGPKEITGIEVGEDGVRVPEETMRKFLTLADLAANNPDDLPEQFKDNQGLIKTGLVAEVLQGGRNFMMDVNGEVPEEFADNCAVIKLRYKSSWKRPTPVRNTFGWYSRARGLLASIA